LVSVAVVTVGLVANTTEPEPVEVVVPVPPFAIGSVPVTPVVSGRPVTLVIVPEVGVPSAGVTSVGLLSVGLLSVAVAIVGLVASTTEPEPVEVVVPVPPEATGRGDPSVSELIVGAVASTTEPEPVEVVVPVPPEATGSAEASVRELRWVVASTTFVPSQYSHMTLPLGTEMPVPADVFSVTA